MDVETCLTSAQLGVSPTLAMKASLGKALASKYIMCIEPNRPLVNPKKEEKLSKLVSISKGTMATTDTEDKMRPNEASHEIAKMWAIFPYSKALSLS